MQLLFIIDHDTRKNINQLIMIVPDEYDPRRVQRDAQECGIRNPNVLTAIPVVGEQYERISQQVHPTEYAIYAR